MKDRSSPDRIAQNTEVIPATARFNEADSAENQSSSGAGAGSAASIPVAEIYPFLRLARAVVEALLDCRQALAHAFPPLRLVGTVVR